MDKLHAKIVILGESSVGKTSIVMRGVRNEFLEFCEPTIGAAFHTLSNVVDNTTVKLEIWDTAGQERYRSLAPMYYRGSSLAMVVYDVTNPDSVTNALGWMDELVKRIDNRECQFVLVGNKSDMGAPTSEMVRTLDSIIETYSSTERPIHHVTVSAKSGSNIPELFDHICRTIVVNLPAIGGRSTNDSFTIAPPKSSIPYMETIRNTMPC